MTRRFWIAAEIATLQRCYADTPTAELAGILDREIRAVYQKAAQFGLRKSAEYLASEHACRLRRGDSVGASTRFQQGKRPWNTGTHFIAGGRSAETRFKPNQVPHNWKPVGTYTINGDGYLDVKFSEEKGPRHKRWKPVHRAIWEQAHGTIPTGLSVVFKPGMFTRTLEEITLDKLEILTRAELMARNTVHNLPKELAQIVQLRGALNRQINKKEKETT